ncbi:hypothetical protein GGR52DRAFT_480791 [Hypoxylon sp. FL1284]|nr:hypothetical protein GGR52DRAFT_480791 [Hypoxylon sp. FL1284]
MKGPAAALCALLAARAIAAPVAVLGGTVGQPDASTNAPTNVHEATQQTQAQPEPRVFLSFLGPSRVSLKKHSKILVADDGRRIQVPEHLAGAKSWETPNVLHFLTFLTRHKKQSPFPDSSIVKEETSANSAETEPQESIVELETKAERESWTYAPYISKDNVLRFRCARTAVGTAMSTALLAVAILAALVLILTLGAALRYTHGYPILPAALTTVGSNVSRSIRTLGTCRHGSIRLEDEEEPTPSRSLSIECQSCNLKSATNPDSDQGALREKGVET